VLVHPSAPSTAIAEPETIAAPSTLTPEEKAIWANQAPHALKNRTLTAASVMAFARYCGVVVREMKERQSSGCDGPNHERMLKRINALELQFGLVPCGKAVYQGEPEKPANPLDKFLNRRRS
jgi:hypothetical protein